MRSIEQCSASKTYPQLGLHPLCLVVKAPVFQIDIIGGLAVVCPRPGWLVPSINVDQAWEVHPAQKTQDAVDLVVVSTSGEYFPTPAKSD